MDAMLDSPTAVELGSAQDAGEPEKPSRRPAWWQSLQAQSTRRALLLTALGGLLIAGFITALPGNGPGRGIGLNAGVAGLGARGNDTFEHAKSGTCLNWPETVPDAAEVVDCAAEHRFEVAETIDLRTFPGSEYDADAAPPSEARIQQISQEQCQVAARQYLGPKYDPNGRFTVGLIWSGDKAWRQSGERRMLCGLQLAGSGNHQLAVTGKVADLDQSKVWSAGTCLGIDATSNQPTDIPIDCAQPHAMEVTGTVNLAEKFPGAMPADPDQLQFVKDTCTQMTNDYLAPAELRKTTLTLIYGSVSLPSWNAGSKQASCSIGAPLGNGGWSTMLQSAKGQLLINGQPPAPVADIPADRLDLPPIPFPTVDTSSQTSQSSQSSQSDVTESDPGQQTQHMPGQQVDSTETQSTAPSTTTGGPPPQGNTFLNGPPPAPGAPLDGPQPADPGAAVPPPVDPALPPAPGAPPPPAEPAPAAPGPVAPGPVAPGPVLPPA